MPGFARKLKVDSLVLTGYVSWWSKSVKNDESITLQTLMWIAVLFNIKEQKETEVK